MNKNSFRVLLSYLLLLFLVTDVLWADTSSEWNERIHKKGITVWTRNVEGYMVDSYRGQTDFDFPIEAVYQRLTHLEGFPDWVQGQKEFEILKDEEESGEYYTVVSAPFLRDRDIVMAIKSRPPGIDGTAFVEHRAIQGNRPLRRNTIRLTDYHETWNLIKLSDSRTRATMEVLFDPGGNLPVKVVNWLVAQGPYEALQTMIKDLGE
ncbi:MAG: hypothetical protein DRP70_13130 [Spirochaetes bacterium]|nr:MAG: hypothetical protein DRP70_13130 [Spirochaetota bacterium]